MTWRFPFFDLASGLFIPRLVTWDPYDNGNRRGCLLGRASPCPGLVCHDLHFRTRAPTPTRANPDMSSISGAGTSLA